MSWARSYERHEDQGQQRLSRRLVEEVGNQRAAEDGEGHFNSPTVSEEQEMDIFTPLP